MPDDPLWREQSNDAKNGKEIFPRIKRARVSNAIREKAERKWEGLIYPSGLSWNMCVARHVYDHLAKGGYVETDPQRLEKMAIGVARHTEWQDALMAEHKVEKTNTVIPTFLVEPNYPQYVLDEMDRKRKLGRTVRDFPEVYVFDDYYPISGYLDLPYRIMNPKTKKRKYVLADFKTKNFTLEEWLKAIANEELPLDKDLCQLYVYLELTEKNNYWLTSDNPTGKMDEIRIAYYCNQAFDDDKIDPEYEYSEEVSSSKREMTVKLLEECRNQILRFRSDEPKVCNYELCTSRDCRT